jgi:molecular chaperone GrpE
MPDATPTSEFAPAAGFPPPAPKVVPVEEAAALAVSYLDQLQRLQAEFDNYRRRVRREQEDWFRQAKAELVAVFLPVLDDLRRARDHAGPDGPPDAAGLVLILRRFEDALNKAGLEEQKAEPGAAFDPEQHEALLVVPSAEQPEGAIVQVVEPGYLFQGKLVRRGKVACSSGPMPE